MARRVKQPLFGSFNFNVGHQGSPLPLPLLFDVKSAACGFDGAAVGLNMQRRKPVVWLTRSAGAVAFFNKPFDGDEFLGAVSTAFKP
jgi:hypothetical protein